MLGYKYSRIIPSYSIIKINISDEKGGSRFISKKKEQGSINDILSKSNNIVFAPMKSDSATYFPYKLDYLLKTITAEEFMNTLENIFKKLRNSTMGKVITGLSDTVQAVQAMSMVTEGQIMKELQILPPKARFQTTLAQLPAWESTGPMEIGSFKFRLYFGMAGDYDARKEVYNPALALFSVNLPQKKGGFLFGPMPGPAYAYGEIAGSLVNALKTNALSTSYDLESALSRILRGAEKGLSDQISKERGTVDLTWGRFQFPPFFVENTRVTFSKETDTNGYPIYAEVSWEGCKTLQVAHWGLLPFKNADASAKAPEEYTTPESQQLDLQTQNEQRQEEWYRNQVMGG
jgi:hypothetical protein